MAVGAMGAMGAVISIIPQILAYKLTLSQSGGGADYAHHITICPPPQIIRPSYGPALLLSALHWVNREKLFTKMNMEGSHFKVKSFCEKRQDCFEFEENVHMYYI